MLLKYIPGIYSVQQQQSIEEKHLVVAGMLGSYALLGCSRVFDQTRDSDTGESNQSTLASLILTLTVARETVLIVSCAGWCFRISVAWLRHEKSILHVLPNAMFKWFSCWGCILFFLLLGCSFVFTVWLCRQRVKEYPVMAVQFLWSFCTIQLASCTAKGSKVTSHAAAKAGGSLARVSPGPSSVLSDDQWSCRRCTWGYFGFARTIWAVASKDSGHTFSCYWTHCTCCTSFICYHRLFAVQLDRAVWHVWLWRKPRCWRGSGGSRTGKC